MQTAHNWRWARGYRDGRRGADQRRAMHHHGLHTVCRELVLRLQRHDAFDAAMGGASGRVGLVAEVRSPARSCRDCPRSAAGPGAFEQAHVADWPSNTSRGWAAQSWRSAGLQAARPLKPICTAHDATFDMRPHRTARLAYWMPKAWHSVSTSKPASRRSQPSPEPAGCRRAEKPNLRVPLPRDWPRHRCRPGDRDDQLASRYAAVRSARPSPRNSVAIGCSTAFRARNRIPATAPESH